MILSVNCEPTQTVAPIFEVETVISLPHRVDGTNVVAEVGGAEKVIGYSALGDLLYLGGRFVFFSSLAVRGKDSGDAGVHPVGVEAFDWTLKKPLSHTELFIHPDTDVSH